MPRDIQSDAPRPDPVVSASERTRALLSIYGGAGDPNLAELIDTFRLLSPVEIAMLQSDARIGAPLERFLRDNRRTLRTPFRQYAALFLLSVCGVLVCAYAALAG